MRPKNKSFIMKFVALIGALEIIYSLMWLLANNNINFCLQRFDAITTMVMFASTGGILFGGAVVMALDMMEEAGKK